MIITCDVCGEEYYQPEGHAGLLERPRFNHKTQCACYNCAEWYYNYRRTVQYLRKLRETVDISCSGIHQTILNFKFASWQWEDSRG
jgi:hypothetical protein